jgi:site-specific DNA-methyltransferase (adenine-specific)
MALSKLAFSYPCESFSNAIIVKADCLQWLRRLPEGSLSAVVTDPPYGVKEYDRDQLDKRRRGSGGVWRIPPSFDGNKRAPLPRFTALDHKARARLFELFAEWSRLIVCALRPGGHLLIATNAFIAPLLYSALAEGGLEFRGEIVRLVRTLRGGDRPKNAEQEFSGTSSLPRGCYEPWGLLRRPLPGGMTVSECLREHGTGALRRYVGEKPFEDVIASERTPRRERELANHPSLKPQSFVRRLVYAALPLGRGLIADPFMGSGSTIAAAEALGYSAVGVERNDDYFALAAEAIPKLARVAVPETDRLVGIAT